MLAFAVRVGENIVRALPATLTRLLLLLTVAGGLYLHLTATTRIAVLERAKDIHEFQMSQLLLAMQGLTDEVRAYREDQREEIKALRRRGVKE